METKRPWSVGVMPTSQGLFLLAVRIKSGQKHGQSIFLTAAEPTEGEGFEPP